MPESSNELRETILKVETIRRDDEVSVASISLRGLNRLTINHRSTILYHVLAGEGTMNVNGDVYELKKGAIVEVPPGTPYFDKGNVDMEAVSIPPFNPEDVEEV